MKIPVTMTSPDGTKETFEGINEAARAANMALTTFKRVLSRGGTHKSRPGYKWECPGLATTTPQTEENAPLAGPVPGAVLPPLEEGTPSAPASVPAPVAAAPNEPSQEPAATVEASVVDDPSAYAANMFASLKTEDGVLITEMRKDGYVNATMMARSAGKLWADFYRLESTARFLTALKEDLQKVGPSPSIMALVQSTPGRYGGTWVHRKVAIHLAQWCSPYFAVKVADLVDRYVSGKVTTEESQAAAKIAQKAIDDAEYESRKRKLELEEAEWEIEKKRQEGKIALQKAKLDISDKERENQERMLAAEKERLQMELANPSHVVESYFSICNRYGLGIDATDRIIAKDYIKNAVFKTGGPSNERVLLPISDVYREVTGRPGDRTKWIAIGKLAAALYRKMFKKDPEKSERYIDGSSRQVSVYQGSDKEWLAPLIEAYERGSLFGIRADRLDFDTVNKRLVVLP